MILLSLLIVLVGYGIAYQLGGAKERLAELRRNCPHEDWRNSRCLVCGVKKMSIDYEKGLEKLGVYDTCPICSRRHNPQDLRYAPAFAWKVLVVGKVALWFSSSQSVWCCHFQDQLVCSGTTPEDALYAAVEYLGREAQ